MARTELFKPENSKESNKIFVPYLPHIFGPAMFKSTFNCRDGVHLPDEGKKIFHDAIADMIRSLHSHSEVPFVLPSIIPTDLSLMFWISEYRN